MATGAAAPFDDIMAVADHMATVAYADIGHMAAAGGSYGGYMVDWILGHTQRFKALVSHDGVYDLRSEFGATEELWFPLWEFRGAPWDNPEMYVRWSPSQFVKEFHTPTLVIHGELDFRVPLTQGLQLFTALQLQKVPSKLLIFPTRGTGCSSRRTAASGTRPSSTGSTPGLKSENRNYRSVRDFVIFLGALALVSKEPR